ncbi:glycosyltransferase family 4 protein [Vibrio splendidus]
MKIFYVGDFTSNNGPATVNKEVVARVKSTVYHCQSNSWLAKPFTDLINFCYSDVVHVSAVSLKGLFFSFLGFLFLKKRFFLMHGSLITESKYKQVSLIRLMIERLLVLLSSKVITVSILLKEKVLILYRVRDENKIIAIPNGVSDCLVESYLNRAPYINRNVDIVTVGGGRPEKNILRICEIISISELSKNVTIHVFGEDGEHTKVIKKYSFVNYHGFVSPDELKSYVESCKVFIQYSEFDSFSIAALEAAVLGCRVLLSSNVGLKDYVDHPSVKVVDDNANDLISLINNALYDVYLDNFVVPEYLMWGKISERYEDVWCEHIK